MKSAIEAAIFLDRDGVLNEVLSKRVKFVNAPEDVYLLPGAAQAVKMLNDLGFKVFIVTNQGGIGLGYMSERDLTKVHARLLDLLFEEAGAHIDDIAYCPDKPRSKSVCRKPAPGMILQLAKKHRVNLEKSFMIGDRMIDIEAGRAAGTRTILITPPRTVGSLVDEGSATNTADTSGAANATDTVNASSTIDATSAVGATSAFDAVFPSLLEAANWISTTST